MRFATPRESRESKGFTLLELMVVTAIIGILAALAVPAFSQYQARSRRAEAFANLASIGKAEKSYFAEYSIYAGALPMPGGAPPSTAKRAWTPAAALAYSTIGWGPEGDVLYDYAVQVGTACPNADCFTAVAYGDTDADLSLSVLQYVQPNASGVTELEPIYGYGPPVDPSSGRVELSEVAVNYNADPF